LFQNAHDRVPSRRRVVQIAYCTGYATAESILSGWPHVCSQAGAQFARKWRGQKLRSSIVQSGCTKLERCRTGSLNVRLRKELSGRETEPWEILYFKCYKRILVIEGAIETAALMLGSPWSKLSSSVFPRSQLNDDTDADVTSHLATCSRCIPEKNRSKCDCSK